MENPMRKESERLKTFDCEDWAHEYFKTSIIAEEGFFFVSNNTHKKPFRINWFHTALGTSRTADWYVECFACGYRINLYRIWKTDTGGGSQEKHTVTCPFVTGGITGNIPLHESKTTDEWDVSPSPKKRLRRSITD
jgi:hypothetical protein